MGDYRATCLIRVRIAPSDKTHKLRLDWVNWSPDNDGVDYRVRSFFDRAWSDAQSVMNDIIWESQREERERAERATFDRLKKKYEPLGPKATPVDEPRCPTCGFRVGEGRGTHYYADERRIDLCRDAWHDAPREEPPRP